MDKKKFRSRHFLQVLLPIIILLFSNTAYADKVNVHLNDKRLDFDTEPIIVEGTTFVPMRSIFEDLGAEVEWKERERKAIAKKEDLTLEIDLNNNRAFLNSRSLPVKKASIMKGSRTLVPLRLISESLGAEIVYKRNKNNSDIYIYTDSSKLGFFKNGEDSISPDVDKRTFTKTLGRPDRIDYYSDNISVHVYNSTNNTYKDYLQIFIDNTTNKVLKLETNSKNWSIDNKIRVGNKYDKNFISEYNKALKEKSLSVYVKESYDNKVSFISIESINMPKELWYENNDKDLDKILKTKEKHIFDYTNVIRINNNLDPFEPDERLQKLARAHSKDMALNNFISHTNKQGLKAKNRFEKERLNLYFGGENLSAGYLSSTESINALFNSQGHRINILNNSTHLGIGVDYNQNSKYRIYHTQVFGRR